MKSLDVIAMGTCYVDTNLSDYPFSPEGIPAEVELIGKEYEIVAGGSAVNFCRLLGSFGLKVAFIGMAGRDANGDNLEASLRHDGITPLLIREDELLTNIGFNMTNSAGNHIMLVAGTANAALTPEAVLPKLQEVVDDAKMLFFGGCFKLKGLAPAFPEIAELAKRHGTDLVIDHNRIPQGTSEELRTAVRALVRQATYYLPSRDEFCELWEVSSIEEGLERLHNEAPEVTVVVKDSANGAFYRENDTVRHIPGVKIKTIYNATGAGDSFNAGVLCALGKGLPLEEAVAYGCRVGAAKVAAQPIPTLE